MGFTVASHFANILHYADISTISLLNICLFRFFAFAKILARVACKESINGIHKTAEGYVLH